MVIIKGNPIKRVWEKYFSHVFRSGGIVGKGEAPLSQERSERVPVRVGPGVPGGMR